MVKKRPAPKNTQVVRITDISDTVKRIYFRSDERSLYNADNLGAYIKLLFHPNGGTDLTSLTPPAKPIMRTYTISEVTDDDFSVDFVMHASSLPTPSTGGYGTYWAENVRVGDTIQMAGPGMATTVDLNTSHTLLIADLTSLPALTHIIKRLPKDINGDLFIINPDTSFSTSIVAPSGVEVTEFSSYQMLEDFMNTDYQWKENKYCVWCACEYTTMRTIRQLCTEHLTLEKQQYYFSSYWKQGMTEDGHKMFKQQDANKRS